VLWDLASPGGHQDYLFKIAVWPAANLLMGAALFYFARNMGLEQTIIGAAAIALVVQFTSIVIDLWLPGTFSEYAARPAGLPQNSNNGALLACFLMAILLPMKLRDTPGSIALYALVVGLPLVFVTLSRSGLVFYLVVLLTYAGAQFMATRKASTSKRRHALFIAAFLPCLLATAFLSPALRAPDAISIWRARIGLAMPDMTPNFVETASRREASALKSFREETPAKPNDAHESTLKSSREETPARPNDAHESTLKSSREETPAKPNDAHESATPQDVLDESIKLSDDTVLQRLNAARFFWSEGLKHPLFGLGTGYGYLFNRGAHNTFLSLFAEDGLPAVMLYLAALLLLTAISIRRQSPALFAIVAIGWLDSMFSHTVLVEPFFLIFAGAALGSTAGSFCRVTDGTLNEAEDEKAH